MSPSEYSSLVDFLSKKFDTIDKRFDGVDARLKAHDDQFVELRDAVSRNGDAIKELRAGVSQNGVTIEEVRKQMQAVAEGVVTNFRRMDRFEERFGSN